jgi:low affinity Fe/Cu permease
MEEYPQPPAAAFAKIRVRSGTWLGRFRCSGDGQFKRHVGRIKHTGREMSSKVSDKKEQEKRGFSQVFGEIASRTSQAAGRASTFLFAALVIVIWAVTGPIFNYSDTWQLVINTGTTIITFLMVFLIQNSQNRDSAAIQVKLDELIRVSAAHNSFVGIEHLTDEELDNIGKTCESRAAAEEAGDNAVKRTGQKARRAADKVAS